MSDAHDEARKAGRGFLWVASAKALFVLTAFGVTITLPVVFGSEPIYGRFAVVFGATSLLNNVLIVSTLQTVSKLVSEAEERARETLRHGLIVQLVAGTTLGGGLVLVSPWIAEFVYHDPERTNLFRIGGAVVFCYALYAALVGSLNGRRLFARQARLDMTFSVLRTAGLIGGAAIGASALGAMAGFALAAAAILTIAVLMVGLGRRGGVIQWRRWIALLTPIAVYQIALNGLLLIDLQVLNVTAEGLAREAGHSVEAAREIADRLAAFYSAAQRFAFVPYQLVLAVTLIIFPFVSKATAMGDREAASRYVANAFRFSYLQLLLVAAPIAGAAEGVLRVAYPDTYVAGTDALRILICGQVAFALFVIGATILTSAGRASLAAAIAGGAVVVVTFGTHFAISWAGAEGSGSLAATAVGTTIGTAIAFLAMGFVVHRIFGALIPWPTLLRGGLAAGAAFAVAWMVPDSTVVGTLAALFGGVVAFGAVLAVTREVGKADLALVLKIVGRRG